MVSDKDKGIFITLQPVTLTTDLMTSDIAAEYVGSHSVDATIRARWQRGVDCFRLLDWQLAELWMDGVLLGPEGGEIPTDFPLQPIVNSCTISSLMRRRLEAMGPGEEA